MKAHFKKEPHFENENSFQINFKNESMFLEIGKVIVFLKIKLQFSKSIKQGSRMFVGAKFNWLIIWLEIQQIRVAMQLKKALNDRSRNIEQCYNNIQLDWYANFGVQQCAVTRKQSIVTASQA